MLNRANLALSKLYKNITLDNVNQHGLDISLTTYCQARCRSCDRTDSITGEKNSWLPLQHMDYNVFCNLVDNMSGIDWIRFAGEYGDPLMYPKLTQAVEYCFKHNIKDVMLNTNGGLRKPQWFSAMAQKHQKKLGIVFGIDGLNHETNWKYREGVDFNRAWENLLAFNDGGGRAVWQFIVFEHNWDQVNDAIDIAEILNLHRIVFILNRSPHSLMTDEHRRQVKQILDSRGVLYDEP